jgi:hypothetical protein
LAVNNGNHWLTTKWLTMATIGQLRSSPLRGLRSGNHWQPTMAITYENIYFKALDIIFH